MVIRDARPADAGQLGEVHVAAWRAAYVGLMPDDYLDELDARDRAAMWTEALARPPMRGAARLVAEDDGNVIGFAASGPEGGRSDAEVGQLYALNVHPDAWGAGVGSELLVATHARLVAWTDEAILWVHPDNDRARRFYERHGWVVTEDTQEEEILGVRVPEVRYRRSLTARGGC